MSEDKLSPIHPGEVLLEEFLKPMNLSENQMALALRVPERRINEIVYENCRITADMALRLARYFNMSPRFWLGLQTDYDLDVAEDATREKLDREVAALATLSDDQIQTDDIPEVQDWGNARHGVLYRPVKQQITLRLDADLIEWFKAHHPQDEGYQTSINRALREYVAQRKA